MDKQAQHGSGTMNATGSFGHVWGCSAENPEKPYGKVNYRESTLGLLKNRIEKRERELEMLRKAHIELTHAQLTPTLEAVIWESLCNRTD